MIIEPLPVDDESFLTIYLTVLEKYKNLAIVDRSRVSCAHNTSRTSMITP